jgi:hypothetical protein
MRHDFMKMLAAMTTLLIAVAIAAPIAAENVYPECPLRRSAEVSFRTPGSHDVLEISIGAGPCYKATLTLVIREGRGGEILYSYVQRFKQHTVVGWDEPDLNEVAAEVVDRMISEPMRSTSSLPPTPNQRRTTKSTTITSKSAVMNMNASVPKTGRCSNTSPITKVGSMRSGTRRQSRRK